MKIYLDQLPPRLASDQGQWWFVKSVIDRVLMTFAYLGTVAVFGVPFRRNDLLVVLIVLMVSAPGRIPFRRMTGEIAWQIIKHWGLTLLTLALIAGVLGAVFPADPVLVEPRVALVWSALSLVTLLGAHTLSPFVAPHLSRLYKKDKVLIVGINDVAVRLSRLIASGEADGQELVGYVEDRSLERLQRPIRERAQRYVDDPALVRNIVADGCERARKLAEETMRDVRNAMGLDYT